MADIDFEKEWDESDLTFVISKEGEENITLYASQVVMKIWSPVIKAMLQEGHFLEGESKAFKLQDKEYDDVLEMLKVLHPPNEPVTGE